MLHPLNNLRLNAGVPIDPELERQAAQAQLKEQKEEPKKEETVLLEVDDLEKTINGVRSVLKNLRERNSSHSGDSDRARVSQRHIHQYEEVLASLLDGELDEAKTAFNHMSPHVQAFLQNAKSGEKKAAGRTFGFQPTKPEPVTEEVITEAEVIQEPAPFDEKDIVINEAGETFEVVALDEMNLGLKSLDSGDVINTIPPGFKKVERENVFDLRDYKISASLAKLLKDNPDYIRENIEDLKSKLEAEDEEGIQEAIQYYTDKYKNFEDDPEKPVNVVDGSSNAEQVYDGIKKKDESPHQLREPGELSDQDQSEYDQDAKVDVPAEVKSALKAAAKEARDEADRLDIRDRDSSYNYRDMANAFDDLLLHLEKGTIYDLKHAQIFASSLMGPFLHKIPEVVWKFLTNAGKTKSLKDFMVDVSGDKRLKDGFGPQHELKS